MKGDKEFHVLPQYLSLVLGIFIQPLLTGYQASGVWNFEGALSKLLFGIIIGIIAFPAVYKRSLDPLKPLFVQLCAIFALGIGWQSLFATVMKTLGQ